MNDTTILRAKLHWHPDPSVHILSQLHVCAYQAEYMQTAWFNYPVAVNKVVHLHRQIDLSVLCQHDMLKKSVEVSFDSSTDLCSVAYYATKLLYLLRPLLMT